MPTVPHNIVPAQNVPRGLSISTVSQKTRVPRRPQHTFFVKHHPYTLQPFAIAPVLAGETLENLSLQSRCVTDPLTSRLVGWWLEHYIFYVPLTAIDRITNQSEAGNKGDRSPVQEMLMDISQPFTGAGPGIGSVAQGNYTAADGYDFIGDLLGVIADKYFRQEGETPYILLGDGLQSQMPMAPLRDRGITQSLFNFTQLPDPAEVDVNATPAPDNWDIEEFDGKYQTWLLLSSQRLTNKTWEEYLADFGVRQTTVKGAEVELLRMSNEWSYPTNTVEPTTGVPTTALSWSVNIRADKKRFFREPGFIFGVTCARPKTYRRDQKGSIAAHMLTALDWMPAAYKDQTYLSIKRFAENTGPFASQYDGAGEGYVLDMRDLFTHGDQYLGDTVATITQANAVSTAANATNSQQRFPTFASIEAMFAGDEDSERLVRQDGILSLNLMGTQVDHT